MKNRTIQLIFQTAYCAFALIGTIGSVGLFNYRYQWDFYIYFTNLSSYFCFAVMLAELIETARKKEDSYVMALPKLKFAAMLCTLLTFLVFNLLLAGAEGRDPALNYRVTSILFHVLLPVMFLADWFLFYERGKVKWFYPFLPGLFAFGYAGYVYIHAAIRGFDSSIMNTEGNYCLIYPYFFLNLEQIGVRGVIGWILLLFAGLTVAGYLLTGLDRLLAAGNRKTVSEK